MRSEVSRNGPVRNFIVLSITILIPFAALAAASEVPSAQFAQVVTYGSGGNGTRSIAAGDVNGDDHVDVVVVNQCADSNCANGSVGVLLGNGDGTFQGVVSYGSGGRGSISVAIGDMNNDGHPDLVVSNGCGLANCDTGIVSVLLGNGDGTFQPAISYSSGDYDAAPVAVGDMNADGHLDVVVGHTTQSVSLLLGNGDGTFRAPTMLSSSVIGQSVGIGDMNGDGKLDIVGQFYYSVHVLLGNGDGTFQGPVDYPVGGYAGYANTTVAIGDVNGDGEKDVIVPLSNVLPHYGSGVGVLLGNMDGTLQAAIGYCVPAWCKGRFSPSVAIGDVNGDGKPDLIVANTSAVSLLLGIGDGTFQGAVTRSAGLYDGGHIVLADVNEDGRPDLLITDFRLSDVDESGAVGVFLNLTHHSSTTKVLTSRSPSFIGQPVTFTATVTATVLIPDGTVIAFYDGTAKIGTGTITKGVASFTMASLALKGHTIKALYPGSAFSNPSSGAVMQNVEKYPTTLSLTAGPNPSNYGQVLTFTATVTHSAPHPPTGTVTFKNATTGLGTVSVNANGVATLSKTTLPVGSSSLTATYNGDATNDKSTSSLVIQTVNPAHIAMTLSSSLNPSKKGQSVTFTATLTSNGRLPSGQTVTFCYNGSQLGAGTIGSGGKAVLSITTLPIGSDVVTAAYAGDANHSSATASVTQAVH